MVTAIVVLVAFQVMGLNASTLGAFAPDLALVVAAGLVLLCLPAALRAGAQVRRFFARQREDLQT